MTARPRGEKRKGEGPLTEQADVDLLQGVHAAELVQLVVDLVEDQGLVVVGGEVPHDVVHCGETEAARFSLSRETLNPSPDSLRSLKML